MEKRVLVIGSTGMLGHQVLRRLESRKDLRVYDMVYRKKRRDESIIIDVNNFDLLRDTIKEIKPDYIVNCVGILIKGSKKSVIQAIKVNALLPHYLVSFANETGAKVIHISTDCVYSGNIGRYHESSLRDADDIYGRTKALGEIMTKQHLTIRTSIIGPELKSNGEGLLHWFLTTDESRILGYGRVMWGGVTTFELAKAIEFGIDNEVVGIWNLTNGSAISKFDILNEFNSIFFLEKKILFDEVKTSDKSLESNRKDIKYIVPNYIDMFRDMRSDIVNNISDYPHYNIYL